MKRLETAGEIVWAEILDEIQDQVGDERFSLWLGNVELTRFDEKRVEIGAPNVIIQEGLEKHFHDMFVRAFERRCGQAPELRFVISAKLLQESRKNSLEAEQDILVEGAQAEKGRRPVQLNSDYRMESFVEGPCNRLAVACARDLIGNNGSQFRPLFVHSGSGLGKTHLLQAIWWAIRGMDDDRVVEYAPAEALANQYVYAIRSRRHDAFRAKYRNVDVLLVDDVHFFATKKGLQEELLHTFDALVEGGGQIVLASDAHPKTLRELKESLVSRFASGMVVRMMRPSLATRKDILRRKALESGCSLGEDVVQHLARNADKNVRELCGALMTIIAYSRLMKRKPDMVLAREAMAGLRRNAETVLDMAAIERVVGRRFGVSLEDLHSPRRTKTIALPRQICMYLARELTNLSCVEIARRMGGRHHTTVVFSRKRVRELCEQDRELADKVEELQKQLAEGSAR